MCVRTKPMHKSKIALLVDDSLLSESMYNAVDNDSMVTPNVSQRCTACKVILNILCLNKNMKV